MIQLIMYVASCCTRKILYCTNTHDLPSLCTSTSNSRLQNFLHSCLLLLCISVVISHEQKFRTCGKSVRSDAIFFPGHSLRNTRMMYTKDTVLYCTICTSTSNSRLQNFLHSCLLLLCISVVISHEQKFRTCGKSVRSDAVFLLQVCYFLSGTFFAELIPAFS
jgi:hypothetical protein